MSRKAGLTVGGGAVCAAFVHVTDLSGKETMCRVTGGMKVKADRDESSPYAAMLAAQDVAERVKVRAAKILQVSVRLPVISLSFKVALPDEGR